MRGHFARLWSASSLSSLGDGVTMTAGPLLAASLTRDPVQVAGLLVAQQLAWMLFALPSGALVDRVDRRFAMTAASVFRMAALLTLAVVIMVGEAPLLLLYAVFFLVGCAGLLYENAATVLLPAIVPPGGLARANGRLLAARTLCQSMIAAPLAGWLFGRADWTPFVFDAVALVAVAALSMTLPTSRPAAGTVHPSLRAAIVEGVRWLMRHRILRTVTITVAVSNVGIGAALSIMVLIAYERLGLDSVGYGLLLAATAVGGIVGGLLANRVLTLIGPGTVLRAGMVVEAFVHVGLALAGHAIAVGVILAMLGLHLMIFSTVCATLRQELVPTELLGRVHSAYRMGSNVGMLLGALSGGVMGRYFGLAAPFWLGFAGVVLVTVLVWRVLGNTHIEAARQAATEGSTVSR
jgi:MFS family permease